MIGTSLVKADLSRWMSGLNIIAIGKWIPLLIAPFVLLLTYGKVQAVQRDIAEQRVEQLTSDVELLSRSLAQVELYNKQLQVRASEHATNTGILNNEDAAVLDLPAPLSVIDILRPY